MSFVSSNDAESKPEMVLALFFVAAARDINKKKHKKKWEKIIAGGEKFGILHV